MSELEISNYTHLIIGTNDSKSHTQTKWSEHEIELTKLAAALRTK